MTAVLAACLVLAAIGGTVVVLTGEPARQAPTLSAFGLILATCFIAYQAPDVSLAEICIGTAVVPLMVMLTVRKLRAQRSRQ